MKLLAIGTPYGKPAAESIFQGDVAKQILVKPDDAKLLRAIVVTLRPGGRTVWHHHDCEQPPLVVGGHGIIAREDEELRVRTGDVVLIPAGTKHGHVSVLTPGAEILDE